MTAELTTQRWELYRALAEPVRLRILALVAEEELAVGELAELLGESQPNASRYVAALKQAGLVTVRREGTRARVALRPTEDAVVADAIASGRAICEHDGSFARLTEALEARERASREYFDTRRAPELAGPPPELGAYLAALAPLIERRGLAVDAGTGDGGLLEVLSPVFERVIAIDRSEAQLGLARARCKAHNLRNITLVKGELDSPEVQRAVKKGADAVFAVRLLHHAARPSDVVRSLAALAAPGGAVIIVDYARHDDETMREHADQWLGFEEAELRGFARAARLRDVHITPIPAPRAKTPDAHLPWQVMTGKKEQNG